VAGVAGPAAAAVKGPGLVPRAGAAYDAGTERRQIAVDRKDNADELKTLEFLQGVAERLPDDVTVLKAVGDLYTRVGLYERGLETDRRLSRLQPSDPGVWYNLGCSRALVRRRAEALKALDRAVQLGYSDHQWMEEDTDLRSLQADAEFKAILQRIKRRHAGAEGAGR